MSLSLVLFKSVVVQIINDKINYINLFDKVKLCRSSHHEWYYEGINDKNLTILLLELVLLKLLFYMNVINDKMDTMWHNVTTLTTKSRLRFKRWYEQAYFAKNQLV